MSNQSRNQHFSTSLHGPSSARRVPSKRSRILLVVAFIGCLSGLGLRAAFAAPTYSGLLRQGSHGAAVVEVQRALGIPADGAFGPQTDRAVRNFQSAHGLSVDGIVGPITWGALFGGSRVSAPPQPVVNRSAPAPAPARAPTPVVQTRPQPISAPVAPAPYNPPSDACALNPKYSISCPNYPWPSPAKASDPVQCATNPTYSISCSNYPWASVPATVYYPPPNPANASSDAMALLRGGKAPN